MKILLATFYTPGIRAMEYLFQAGYKPEQIRVLTHDIEKNRFLIDYVMGNRIEMRAYPVKSNHAFDWISEFQPDVIFSLYFRDIIPQSILDIPNLGAVNLHPALLPKYRGTFSAPWVILNGEQYTGFTYHYMKAKVDSGNIVVQRKVKIYPNDTAFSLYHRLLTEGMAAFGEAFKLVVEEHYQGVPQVGEPSYYPRVVPFGGYIDPNWSREQVDKFIRAMYFPPFKGALIKLSNGIEKEVNTISEYDALFATDEVLFSEPVHQVTDKR